MSQKELPLPQDIPSTVLVMGGNWQQGTSPDRLLLSLESRLRVTALGVLAAHEMVDTAIFTAGLTKGPNQTPEAAAQHEYLRRHFPETTGLRIFEEDMGHTTKADAEYTAQLVEEQVIEGPFGLLTSRAFVPRQTRVFERRGFEIVPIAAEPIVATLSPLHRAFVRRYNRSSRHLKVLASEAVLGVLDRVDPEARITEWLAARSRSNHKPTAS